jgi:hypothetical protein
MCNIGDKLVIISKKQELGRFKSINLAIRVYIVKPKE